MRPAAHYAMGGVKTDLQGSTTVTRLFAAGEAACTGVHGANRLASNSLLEAAVFGRRAGAAMAQLPSLGSGHSRKAHPVLVPSCGENELRTLTWNACGVLRSGPELAAAYKKLANQPLEPTPAATRAQHEIRNMHQVGLLIARAALGREESRGGHYRIDFPQKSAAFEKHSILRKVNGTDAELSFV